MLNYMKLTVTRIDDGSLYYHMLKNYERIRTYIIRDITIKDNEIRFSSAGQSYLLEADKYNISIEVLDE